MKTKTLKDAVNIKKMSLVNKIKMPERTSKVWEMKKLRNVIKNEGEKAKKDEKTIKIRKMKKSTNLSSFLIIK